MSQQTSRCHKSPLAEEGLLSIKLVVIIVVVGALVPIALVGWRELYTNFLEANPPVISVVEGPRGVGRTPVSLVLRLTDKDAGLDEIVVRVQQKRDSKEILRQHLDGKKEAEVTLPFEGRKSGLDEGTVTLQIRVFDRSFWSSKGEKNYTFQVDYGKPEIEVLSTQHNAREGGSQLIFYKAYDENLALSGVKVDGQTFIGFPARGIDSSFEDPSVYVAIYAVPLQEAESKREIRLFAEDRVGNGNSKGFYNKVAKRRIPERVARLDEKTLRPAVSGIFEKSKEKLEHQARSIGQELSFQSPEGSLSRLVEEFQLLERRLRPMNEGELLGLVTRPRHELLSQGAFLSQEGVVRSGYGEKITYLLDKTPILQYLRTEYLLGPARNPQEVFAANDGVVLSVGDFGVYGNTVVIDHGLGLSTIYASLDEFKVRSGDRVTIGDVIGTYGKTGLAERTQLLFQLRVHGVPVDPTEWLSKTWYQAHVVSKIEDAKRTLGIAVYEGF